MRRITLGVSVVAAVAAAYTVGRLQSHLQPLHHTSGRRIAYYVDPMHPSYKSDKAGTAPDCGMPLVAVYADDLGSPPSEAAATPLPPGWVNLDPATRQLLGIQVAPVERNSASHMVRAVGRVLPEDTRVYRVNSGVDGFIRDTFKDSVGTFVKKDQTIATYFAPDFLAVASGFLAAVERVPGADGRDGSRTVPLPGAVSKQGVSSLQGYTDRLRNLGMSEVQIQHVANTRQLPEMIDVVSPVDGFILGRNVSPGQHFEHAMELYRIADLSKVWVVAEVDEQEASYLHAGVSATITLRDLGRRLPARIADSLPQSETGGGSVKFRLEVDNPSLLLRPDMVVDVELPVRLLPAITVPVDAVVDSGNRSRVYIERGQGVFEPREVQAGWRSSDRIQIVRGLEPGERVLAAATFLIDSESRLKSAPPAPPPAADRPVAEPQHMTMRGHQPAGGHHGHGDD